MGGADDFGAWTHPKQKKNKNNYCSVRSWLRPELELKIFINKQQNGGLVKKILIFFVENRYKKGPIIIIK